MANIASGAPAQYQEGETDATIDGVVVMWEDTGNVIRATSAAFPLPVTVISGGGGGGGTEYTEGAVDATITGTACLAEGPGNTLEVLQVNASKQLEVHLNNTGGATDSIFNQGAVANGSLVAIAGNPTLIAGASATNVRTLLMDNNGRPNVVGAVAAGSAIGTSNPVLMGGSDGTNVRRTLVDSTGATVCVGAGQDALPLVGFPVVIAGSDYSGGGNVRTMRMSGAGRPSVEVNGTVTVAPGSGFWDDSSIQGLVGSGAPSNGSVVAFFDGTDVKAARVYDTDTGAGSEWTIGVQLRGAASGGSVAIGGDATNGLDVDVTNVVPGNAAADLGKAEDAVHTTGDTGVMALAVANEANSNFGADGDYTPLGVDREGSTRAIGNRAHDAVDSGNPIKIGVRATDMTPDTDAEQGPTEVADGDRVNLVADLRGALTTSVNARYNVLTNVSTTYNNTTTTATSAAVECWQYRQCTLCFSLSKANTPTDIRFRVLVSADGTNYFDLTNDALASLLYDDVVAGTSPNEAYTFPLACQSIKIQVDATGTSASNTFTVTNAAIYLRN